jgi:hypothetical protein
LIVITGLILLIIPARAFHSTRCQPTLLHTASADGTIISGGTESVATIDGVWQFGSVSGNGWNLQLNGIPVTAGYLGTGGLGGVTPVSLIDVNAHGQLFAQGADGVADGGFLQWVAQEIQLGPVTVPSGPVPVDMRFNPPCPNLSLIAFLTRRDVFDDSRSSDE